MKKLSTLPDEFVIIQEKGRRRELLRLVNLILPNHYAAFPDATIYVPVEYFSFSNYYRLNYNGNPLGIRSKITIEQFKEALRIDGLLDTELTPAEHKSTFPKNTIGWWYDKLPPKIAKLAKLNFYKHKTSFIGLDDIAEDFQQAINTFVWEATPENHEYWRRVHQLQDPSKTELPLGHKSESKRNWKVVKRPWDLALYPVETKLRCSIRGECIEGVLQQEFGSLYICHNNSKAKGISCSNRLGKDYSYKLGNIDSGFLILKKTSVCTDAIPIKPELVKLRDGWVTINTIEELKKYPEGTEVEVNTMISAMPTKGLILRYLQGLIIAEGTFGSYVLVDYNGYVTNHLQNLKVRGTPTKEEEFVKEKQLDAEQKFTLPESWQLQVPDIPDELYERITALVYPIERSNWLKNYTKSDRVKGGLRTTLTPSTNRKIITWEQFLEHVVYKDSKNNIQSPTISTNEEGFKHPVDGGCYIPPINLTIPGSVRSRGLAVQSARIEVCIGNGLGTNQSSLCKSPKGTAVEYESNAILVASRANSRTEGKVVRGSIS